MKIIDLSHYLENKATTFPGSPKPQIKQIATIENNGYREKLLAFSSHFTTHIDAPCHILKYGKCLDDFELTKFYGTAICINFDKVEEWLKKHYSLLEQMDFILLNTNFYKYWYSEKYLKNFPTLPLQIAKQLANLNLKAIGIDTISFDPIDSQNLEIHTIFLSREIVLIENLNNLAQVENKIFKLTIFPLKIKQADGSPVRAVAIFD